MRDTNRNIHYDLLMMSQKEAGASQKSCLFGVNCRKLIDNDGCNSQVLPSAQEAPVIFYTANLNRNSNRFTYFCWKHQGKTQGCLLGASFCDIINGSQCTFVNAFESDNINHPKSIFIMISRPHGSIFEKIELKFALEKQCWNPAEWQRTKKLD